MPVKITIETWSPLETFETDYKKLPENIQTEVQDSLKKLLENPNSTKLRLKPVTGSKKPKVYAIHITANHSYKLTFEMDGTTAVLRRVGTHKKIDNNF